MICCVCKQNYNKLENDQLEKIWLTFYYICLQKFHKIWQREVYTCEPVCFMQSSITRIWRILFLRFVFSFCRTEYIWEIPTIQRLLAWLWNSPLCSLCCVSRNERLQGERYAWFNASISHQNSITLTFSLLMAVWIEEKKQKLKFQIIFALGNCFTTTALLFVSLERPLI